MVELQANTAGISGVVGFSVLGYNYLVVTREEDPEDVVREHVVVFVA
jgi:hypothetical protein